MTFDNTIDPSESWDYVFDWAEERLAAGENIIDVAWKVPPGITQDLSKSGHTATTTTIWLSGAQTLGATYEIGCTVTTDQGRTEVWAFSLYCVDKTRV